MVKQLKLINDFYYCRPGKGALSSNTCLDNISIRFTVFDNLYETVDEINKVIMTQTFRCAISSSVSKSNKIGICYK